MKRIDDLPRISTGLPDEFLLLMKEHEAELFDFLTGKGDTGQIMIDVGAHAGKWAVQFADEWKRVLAFEPNPVTFRALCDVIVHYNAANVVPICAGAGSTTGIFPLTVYADRPSACNFVGHHDWWPDDRISGTWPATVLALDSFISGFEQQDETVGFVKIDTEGADLAVLDGAFRLLTLYRPMLLVELHEAPGQTPRDESVRAVLKAAGYEKEARIFQYGDMRYLFAEREGRVSDVPRETKTTAEGGTHDDEKPKPQTKAEKQAAKAAAKAAKESEAKAADGDKAEKPAADGDASSNGTTEAGNGPDGSAAAV